MSGPEAAGAGPVGYLEDPQCTPTVPYVTHAHPVFMLPPTRALPDPEAKSLCPGRRYRLNEAHNDDAPG
jgi:hypothetical protein